MNQSTGNRRPRPTNVYSKLLNEKENEKLFSIIGSSSVSLASAVLQVLVAEPPSTNVWSKKCCGVGCFIKDNHRRSYYIRVYDLKLSRCIWEQEVYNQFVYSGSMTLFHVFEADNCSAGLNFANDAEANAFKSAICVKLKQRQMRKQARKRESTPQTGASNSAKMTSPVSVQAPSTPTFNANSGKDTLRKREKDEKKKNKGKNKLTKDDIGTPTNFRHVGHVGWDPEKGFDMNKIDPDLKSLFNRVGISEEQLRDKDTATFIYDFIEKHGGVEAVKQETERGGGLFGGAAPAMLAPVAVPAPNRTRYGAAPPPLPNRGPQVPQAPPPQVPHRGNTALPATPPRGGQQVAPPPPPPSNRYNAGTPPPPPPTRTNAPSVAPPPPPQFPPGIIPPPPPPGPPPVFGIPSSVPAPPPPPPSGPAGIGAQSQPDGLLSQIRGSSKTQLQHVTAKSTPAPANSRDNLMSQIKGGYSLKPVDPSENDRPKAADDEGGLEFALKNAMLSRANQLKPDYSSDEDDDDSEDDDEWDD